MDFFVIYLVQKEPFWFEAFGEHKKFSHEVHPSEYYLTAPSASIFFELVIISSKILFVFASYFKPFRFLETVTEEVALSFVESTCACILTAFIMRIYGWAVTKSCWSASQERDSK